MSTFVSVGNARQPFPRLLDAVASIIDRLPQPVRVQHGHTPFEAPGCECIAFMGMEAFAEAIEQAELVILHAGAGSAIQAIRAGKVPVVMPRLAQYGEHVHDHQLELARALASTGKVAVAHEAEELLSAVHTALEQAQQQSTEPAKEPEMVGLIRDALAEYAQERNHGSRGET